MAAPSRASLRRWTPSTTTIPSTCWRWILPRWLPTMVLSKSMPWIGFWNKGQQQEKKPLEQLLFLCSAMSKADAYHIGIAFINSRRGSTTPQRRFQIQIIGAPSLPITKKRPFLLFVQQVERASTWSPEATDTSLWNKDRPCSACRPTAALDSTRCHQPEATYVCTLPFPIYCLAFFYLHAWLSVLYTLCSPVNRFQSTSFLKTSYRLTVFFFFSS